MNIKTIDLFSGAGGSSHGARDAGVELLAAFDRWDLAREVYDDNFPGVATYGGALRDHDPRTITRRHGAIDLIIASPECTSHSVARGSRRRSEASRSSALEVTRFAKTLKPRWIVVENVASMRNWPLYDAFIEDLRGLGYNVSEQTLNAADFGVPQRRRRLFILCDLEKEPGTVRATARFHRSARSIVDSNGTYQLRPLFTPDRAQPTLDRACRAIVELGQSSPFLLVYYGSDYAGGWQRLDVPLRTITTLDRFALVRPSMTGHVMRMLQVPELQRAMGFPRSFRLLHGTRRDRIKLLGNAVCAPVMRAVVRTLTGSLQ